MNSLPTVYPEELSQKGLAIYQKISSKMEEKNLGKYLAIEDEKDHPKTVPATLTAGSEALAGTSLFADYELQFDFPNKRITLTKSLR
ncbi:MAG: hypothetical protein ABH807_00790 [Candidatus Shapirobacteria bacterium]